MRRLLLISIALLSAFSASADVDKALLEQLDGYLKNRENYVARKEERIATGRKLLSQSSSPEDRFKMSMRLADEFFSYRFDSTQAYLHQAIKIAEDASNADLAAEAGIRLGYLYTKSGNYMEAYDRLFIRTDSTKLSNELRTNYYSVLYEFSRDISGNSGMVERLSIPKPEYYRNRLYGLIPEHGELSNHLKMAEFREKGEFNKADSLGHILISMVPSMSHAAAKYYYDLSEIAWEEHRSDDQETYLIASAQCDIVNAVKDYASLSVLAQAFIDKDVDRSFHYLRIAQEDALIYNSRLRPWQISQFFMDIENHYEERQATMARLQLGATVLLGLMVIMLAAVVLYAVSQSRKLREAHDRLSEAGQVKENYITKFLKDLSSSIATVQRDENHIRKLLKQGRAEELLRELTTSSRAQESLDQFYRIFDETFLGLYPDFVQQFNALLKPEARMQPKKDGQLNTELRIFALIRLGIDDSKDIASLLHYSLSTIYNYKVAVKNNALGDRENFEREVKKIGEQS